ncbi:hypothetical protein ACFWCB_02290 [Streptomyces sp. NPDC060048]|uniref:hypothetical protein n=1 Tax=unclassified Streptomyces TaxID=2593676 RepID=UPI00368EDE7D
MARPVRQYEYLVAVEAENELLTCHTLHWADEIRDPRREIGSLPGRVKSSAKEVRMAEQRRGTKGSGGAAKKRLGSGRGDLRELTKAELYERATAAQLPGRSTMTREQLVAALGKASSAGTGAAA